MYLTKITIENVGPYKKFSTKLKQGLVGVFGKNGTGKSWFMNLIYAALTNDFGRFKRTKDTCVNDSAEEGVDAFVEIEAQHGAHSFKLRRSIVPSKSLLTVAGDNKVISNTDKIRERLTEILDFDLALFDICGFKEQHAIFDIISGTDTERLKAFQKLCRTDNCEVIWNGLGTFIDGLDLGETVIDNSDELVEHIRADKAELAELQTKIEEARGKVPKAETIKTAKAILSSAERIPEFKRQLREKRDSVATLTETKSEHEATWRKAEKARDAAKEEVAAWKVKGQEAQAAIQKWAEWEEVNTRLRRHIKAGPGVTRSEAPEAPTSQRPSEEVIAKLGEMTAEFKRAFTLLESIAAMGKAPCPKCGTETSKIAQTKALTIEARDRAKAYMDKYRPIVAEWAKYDSELADYKELSATVEKVISKYETVKSELEKRVEDKPLLALELAKVNKDKYDDARETLESVSESAQSAEIQAEKAETALAAAKARVKELEASLKTAEDDATPERVAWANAKILTERNLSMEIAKWTGSSSSLREGIERNTESLKALKVRIKRVAGYRKLAEILEEARNIFHRENLPKLVAQVNLGELEKEVNSHLASFGSPFWVETAEDLTFTAHMRGGYIRPANQLSTGQCVILATSFWLAVSPMLGLLALDEPTANLDEDNRAFLAETLVSLAGTVRGARQIIMITHAEELKPCFDQIIEIKN